MINIPKVLTLDNWYLWARQPGLGFTSPNATPPIRAIQHQTYISLKVTKWLTETLQQRIPLPSGRKLLAAKLNKGSATTKKLEKTDLRGGWSGEPFPWI